jgi:hypothetical protein
MAVWPRLNSLGFLHVHRASEDNQGRRPNTVQPPRVGTRSIVSVTMARVLAFVVPIELKVDLIHFDCVMAN